MDYAIDFSAKAQQDLREIVSYIARDSRKAAEKTANQILERIVTLKSFPEQGMFVSDPAGVRRLLHKPYIIFYTLKSHRVTIQRILHGARDRSELKLD